ncbi:ATP-binding protein [bacterium]|nr:ATP-binding protein [bacterium]
MEQERAREIFEMLKVKKEESINEFILSRKAEELFLDFKRSADNGAGEKLHHIDRNHLAKSISGFGNSEGGVIVWGVDCSRDFDGADVAKAKFPLENVDRFVSLLHSAISGCTIPPHSEVEILGIREKGKKSGFAASLIPKSMKAPHQVIYNMHYYMRAGSNFVPVPHAILSGLFGRRPEARIGLNYGVKTLKASDDTIECSLGFNIINNGRGIARDTYLIIEVLNLPGPCCTFSANLTDENWTYTSNYRYKFIYICKEHYRIPPSGLVTPVDMNFTFARPFERDLRLRVTTGCEGSETIISELGTSGDLIEAHVREILSKEQNGRPTGHYDSIKRIFNIK